MTKAILIDRPNLSLAWADAFTSVRSTSGHRLTPLTLSFGGISDDVVEEPSIRTTLDAALAASDMQKVQTVANTIFPQALWRAAKGDRQAFYANYRENLPEYVAMEPNKNRRGLYFGRLIAYDVDPKDGERLAYVPEGAIPENGNQLEFIIQRCKKGVRVSAFQASLFDPARDHTAAAQLGFGYRVALPVAAYYTWNGTNLEGKGVTPDVDEPLCADALGRGDDNQLRRAQAEVARHVPVAR